MICQIKKKNQGKNQPACIQHLPLQGQCHQPEQDCGDQNVRPSQKERHEPPASGKIQFESPPLPVEWPHQVH